MQEKNCITQTDAIRTDVDIRPFQERAGEIRDGKRIKDIAQACGISESMVSRYFSGVCVPPDDVAQKIMQFLSDEDASVMQTMQLHVQLPIARPDEKISDDDAPDTITLPVWAYQEQMADYQKTIDELRTDHEKAIHRMQCQHYVMLGIVVALLAVIIYLVVDATHGGWGFFRSAADLICTGAL